jgi:hypothetical protein
LRCCCCYFYFVETNIVVRITQAFANFEPHELAQVEPRTIFQLAENPKKYATVFFALAQLPQITQDAVRNLIQQCRTPRQPKQEEKPSIWLRTADGSRVCQIPPIHEQETGVTLQQMMDEEGLTAQNIIIEAIALRQAYIEGRLVATETDVNVSVSSRLSGDEHEETPSAIAPQVELFAEYSSLNEQPALGEEDSSNDGGWTFEPEPEKDDLDDDEAEGDYNDYVMLQRTKQEKTTELSPVELLVETFQSCSSWQEVSEVLKIHDEYKQQAWDALTPLEIRRVMAIMPLEIQKLSEAKKAGKIIDYKELRSGVYQIQHEGCLFWEVVTDSSLDAFLAQL